MFQRAVRANVKPDEYLEGVFRDAFKRELESDENVARTLPFFAAALAFAATLYNFIFSRLPPLAWSPFSITLHLLLGVASVCLVAVVWFLLQAVREREYRIPPKETEQLEWSAELEEHFKGEGYAPKTVADRVVAELRAQMLREYAQAAEHNRQANKPRLQARTWGFTFLVVLLGIAFLMIGIMFAAERVTPLKGDRHVQADKAGSGQPADKDRSRIAATPGSEVAGGAGGDQDSGVAGGQHGSQPLSTPPSKSPTPVSVPAAAANPKPLPQAPSHQLLKKNLDGGGPFTERR